MTHHTRYLAATFVAYILFAAAVAVPTSFAAYHAFEGFECKQRERTVQIEENT